jgi:hypothetical protein
MEYEEEFDWLACNVDQNKEQKQNSYVAKLKQEYDTSSTKVSTHVHDDIALSILSKLPFKSLTRFACVRKSWSLLFENPSFMTMYRNNFVSKNCSHHDGVSLLLSHGVTGDLYSLSGERFENRTKLDWPNLSQEQTDFLFFGSSSANGIVCLHDPNSDKVVLWDPSTKEVKVVPLSPLSLVESSFPYDFPVKISLHGFGYDHVMDDYKLIRSVALPLSSDYNTMRVEFSETIWEIYSLRSNSWSQLDVDLSTQMGPQCYNQMIIYKERTHSN